MIRRCGGWIGALMAVVLLVLLEVTPGAADETPEDQTQEENEVIQNTVFTLGEIEVFAKAEESKNTTLEKVFDEEMRLFNRDNLAEALNLTPGVTLSEAGARNEKMIHVRGFDIKHVPLFLDGVPIYVPYDGYPDLARFSTFDLSEVVVSKGFTSVLYGPNTMGGAVNMVSRRPDKALEVDAGTGCASGEAFQGYGNFGTNQGQWYVQGGGAYNTRDYFSVANDFTQTDIQGDGQRVNSGRTDAKGNIKVGLTPNGTDEYALSYIRQQGDKDVPPYTGYDSRVPVRWWRWPDWDKESVYLSTKTALWDRNYVKTRLYYDTFKNALHSYDDATFTTMEKKSSFKSYYDDYTYGGSMEVGTERLPNNLIKTAFHYKADIHREHNAGNPVQHFEDNIVSIGIEDTIDFTPKIYSIVGAGYDAVHTEDAEHLDSKTKTITDFPTGDTSAFNPQAGLFYNLTDADTVHASVAQKSRMPSLKDKYSYKMGAALPNPDLDPETAVNYEVGYQVSFIYDFMVETAVFYSDINDFILSKTIPDPDNPGKTLNQNQNVGKVHQYGAEFGVSGQILDCLEGGVNYTYIHYNNESGPDKLMSIPNHKIFSHLRYFFPITGLSLLGSVEYNGDRYSSSDGVRVADSYTLAAAKVIYDMPKGFSIEGGVNNLTDENYAVDEGYPLEGRAFFANLSYQY